MAVQVEVSCEVKRPWPSRIPASSVTDLPALSATCTSLCSGLTFAIVCAGHRRGWPFASRILVEHASCVSPRRVVGRPLELITISHAEPPEQDRHISVQANSGPRADLERLARRVALGNKVTGHSDYGSSLLYGDSLDRNAHSCY